MADMFTASLSNSSGLVVRYDFSADNIKKGTPGANGIARVITATLGDIIVSGGLVQHLWLLILLRIALHCIALQHIAFVGHGKSCGLTHVCRPVTMHMKL